MFSALRKLTSFCDRINCHRWSITNGMVAFYCFVFMFWLT